MIKIEKLFSGNDGKLHRQYTPKKPVTTDEELCVCIDILKQQLGGVRDE